ncbi:MAG: STAS domain-containing protein [Actinomycetales bacterium]|nr:STAS domain-containing protein [Actinomycetales bacterium]
MNHLPPLRTDETFGDETGTIRVVLATDHARLVLSGEVDARLNADLARATQQLVTHGRPVDVETSGLTFVDSAVIALVAHLANRLAARVRFVAPTAQVRFLLEVTQVDQLVDIVDVPAPHGAPAAEQLDATRSDGGTERAPESPLTPA